MSSDRRLVYSTDPAQNRKCDRCKEVQSECRCPPQAATPTKSENSGRYNFVAKLRIEKQGRGGKTVTVIDDLPKNILFLKDLTTLLKKKCGTGGTYSMEGKEGLIEIQGDKRDQIRGLLEKEGIRTKG
ncbi:MAG: translation initiation factor [Bacteriovoracia bacterium]